MPEDTMPTERTLLDLLQRRAEQYRDKVAFSFSDNGDQENRTQLTFRELDTKARAIASTLQQQGAAGQRVLVLVRPGLDFVAGFFGCAYAGAVAVPVHERLLPRLTTIVPDAQAAFALTPADRQADTQAAVAGVDGGQSLRWCVTDAVDADAEKWAAPDVDPSSPALIQYTSGSTRSPKGVVLTHRNLMHNVEAVRQAWNGEDTAIGAWWLPPHHDMGLIGGILSMVYIGCTTVLMSPTAFIKHPMRWLEAISRYRATYTAAPNFAYESCVKYSTPAQRAALDLSCLTTAMNGAEPVRATTLAAFADAFAPAGFRLEAFMPVYGLAEATLLVSGGSEAALPGVRYIDRGALGEDRVVDVAPEDPGAAPFVGCGRPRGGQDLRIVDPVTRRACGSDEVGEIWIAGPSVAPGYWGRPEETEQTFAGFLAETAETTGEPTGGADTSRGPFLRTGDLGFLCAGELFITGRCKDLVVIDGHNYYPNDIEFTVQDCHPVLVSGRGAVFAVAKRQDALEQLVVVQEVDRDRAGEVDLAGVMHTIRAAITEHHGISAHDVVLVEYVSVPTTSSGKIRRAQCRQQFADGDLKVVADWHAPPSPDDDADLPSLEDLQEAARVVGFLQKSSALGPQGFRQA